MCCRIQRAWRSYVDEKQNRNNDTTVTTPQQQLSPQAHSRVDTDPESVVSDYSEMNDLVKEHLANVQIIRKEDLAIANTMPNSDLFVKQRVVRLVDESDADYAKRLRKFNFLSLAQEFAELKKSDSNALPYDAHKTPLLLSPLSTSSETSELASDMSDSVTTTPGESSSKVFPPSSESCNNINAQLPDNAQLVGNANESLTYCFLQHNPQHDDVTTKNVVPTESSSSKEEVRAEKRGDDEGEHLQDFDVFNMEATLPQLDWAKIEEELQKEEKQKLVSFHVTSFTIVLLIKVIKYCKV